MSRNVLVATALAFALNILSASDSFAVDQSTEKIVPAPITLDYFGLVFSDTDPTRPWPSVPFGSWRMWDARVTWSNLEPARGKWDFALLDRMVADAEAHHTKILLVLAHSPFWASARPTEPSGYGLGLAAEPNNISDWTNYVHTVVARYSGRIEAYQVWNEPSDKMHFSGSVQQLVELTCSAYTAIKKADPAAKVVSAGSAGGGYHIDYQEKFLAAGGAKCIDVVAHHFYVPRFGPEAMVPLIRSVRAMMRRQGVGHLPLWNTETGWWVANTDSVADAPAVAKGGWRKLDADAETGSVIQRAFLLARAEGIERFYWYNWANPYGWSLTDGQGTPKPATKYWDKVVQKVLGKAVLGCDIDKLKVLCRLVDRSGVTSNVGWNIDDSLTAREGAVGVQTRQYSLPVSD